MTKRLFVYGTLKQGYSNNVLLRGAKFLGPAITKKNYVLFNCGFPKAVTLSLDKEAYPMLPVIGELYEVEDNHIRSCDQLEGHPDWYRRDVIEATLLATNETFDTNIYEMNEWVGNRLTCKVVNGAYEWDR